jgi:hypothetical protein
MYRYLQRNRKWQLKIKDETAKPLSHSSIHLAEAATSARAPQTTQFNLSSILNSISGKKDTQVFPR